jgi:hypothetical protein
MMLISFVAPADHLPLLPQFSRSVIEDWGARTSFEVQHGSDDAECQTWIQLLRNTATGRGACPLGCLPIADIEPQRKHR